jgi:predicted ATPase
MPTTVSSPTTFLTRPAKKGSAAASLALTASPTALRLPAYRTRWVGAELQAARLQALIREHRLVTLLGPGGCGKTRLAVEVARLSTVPTDASHHERGEGRAAKLAASIFERAFCVGAADFVQRLAPALAAVSTLSATSLASADAGTDAGADAGEASGRVLLLLDNCEQLDVAAAQQIALFAELMPQAHCLLTSRRPMGLDGEREFMMSGLELPGDDAAADVETYPAVSLFVDRARAHRADFAAVPTNSHDLLALVRALDGLPLAIELAASHARTLSPAHMLALLRAAKADAASPDSGLKWLARRGHRSGNDSRHASMWHVIDVSWQLLTPSAQALLDVWCAQPHSGELEATLLRSSADALDELLAHSMLQTVVDGDGALQHGVGELVRTYVRARHPVAGGAPS